MGGLKTAWSLKTLSNRQIASRVLFALIIAVVLTTCGICSWNALKLLGKPFPGFFFNERMAVGAMGQPHWTGMEAGLKTYDRVVRANDKEMHGIRDLEEVVRRGEIGDQVNYSMERDGRSFEVPIPTMRFEWTDLMLTFGIVLFFSMVYLIIGLVVFVIKPDTEVSWVFFSACMLQSLSSVISFDVEATHLGFVRGYLFDESVLPAVVMHLSWIFPERLEIFSRRKHLKFVPYVLSGILFVLLEWVYPGPSFGSIYKVVLLFVLISVLSFVFSISYAFVRHRSALARQRAKVVLMGATLGLPIPALAPLLMILGISPGGGKVLSNFSSIPILLFPVSIAYAIAKHNLFDVDVYVKRAVGYGIMTAVVGSAYFGIQVLIESAFVGPVFGEYAGKVSPVIFALVVVFLFNPLNRRVQEGVDRLFYRKKYDYRETVTKASDALSSVLNLEEIIRKIVHTVRREMFIDTSGVVMVASGGTAIQGYFAGDPETGGGSEEKTENNRRERGEEKDEIRAVAFPKDDPLVALVSREKKLITKYDLAEDPRYASVRDSCAKRFEEMGASMAIPLVYQGEVEGILAVGHKKSGHFYSREDVDLLTTLAGHGAVSLVNARMAEQMQKEEIVRTNLARYLSPQIVDKIVKHDVQVNLGGDRKVVTVLFSDIRNFTTITESRPPDQLVHILNEYFTEMAKIIFDHQGSLDKYIGDAIVAVFGSLIPLENPAENAVAAAVAMMKRLPALNLHWEARYGFSMNIGIGINTGEVFLGNIGSPERMEFTVIGDAVNVASRFSGLAKSGQILVTKDTLACLGPGENTKELPPAEVKGKSGKMEVFEVVYAHPVS